MPHNSAFGVGRAIVPAAAMNGLGLLGILRSDPSYDLRERAACNLAYAGMLWRDLRRNAVPEPIRFLQDWGLDRTARKWVLQALERNPDRAPCQPTPELTPQA
jgi:hypothetical protein